MSLIDIWRSILAFLLCADGRPTAKQVSEVFWDSSISLRTDCGLDRSSFPGRGTALYPQLKRTKREADLLPPSSRENKNTWNWPSINLYYVVLD